MLIYWRAKAKGTCDSCLAYLFVCPIATIYILNTFLSFSWNLTQGPSYLRFLSKRVHDFCITGDEPGPCFRPNENTLKLRITCINI